MTVGKLLFHSGIALMIAAVVAAPIATALLISAWKRLQLRLDERYGKKRR